MAVINASLGVDISSLPQRLMYASSHFNTDSVALSSVLEIKDMTFYGSFMIYRPKNSQNRSFIANVGLNTARSHEKENIFKNLELFMCNSLKYSNGSKTVKVCLVHISVSMKERQPLQVKYIKPHKILCYLPCIQ